MLAVPCDEASLKLSAFADESVRQVVLYLMNLVEKLSAKVEEQAEEIERLGEENNRLKGEQGKPKIKANKPARELSSEKERRESKPHHKENKQAQIRVDRVEVLKVDQERLPPDAQFKGYGATRLVQTGTQARGRLGRNELPTQLFV